MDNMLALWGGLDTRRRVVLVAATVGVFLAVLGLARVANSPSMALLYAGLDGAAAGEVVTALDARGLTYEVRGDAIFVDHAMRDETRMMLAAEGLPTNAITGYELLDGLSGFGTTSQMFDAAYWRAKEGELARTILSSPHIRSARVHISQGTGAAFRRDGRPTASVSVTTGTGTLSPVQARALQFLVASAVAGMAPEDVSVIDGQGGLISGSDADQAYGGAGADRAAILRRNVERLLEAHVGIGRAVVEVSVDTVTDRETIVERRFDPEGRVAISSEAEERTRNATDTRAAGVTVASNLPDGDAAGGDGQSETRDSETRQVNNYEVSQTQREVQRAPGAVRRLTVAVMVDGTRGTDEAGEAIWTPRPEAELEALRELVASAVGFDEARGDVITLRSLPFEVQLIEGSEPSTSIFGPLRLDPMTVISMALLSLMVLVLTLFVLRPMLRGAQGGARSEVSTMDFDDDFPAMQSPALAIADGYGGGFAMGMADGMGDGAMGMEHGGADRELQNDPMARLRNLIEERQSETAEILRNWLDEKEERR
ncbi:flagellar M-ring protein FliF [Roseicitreum antarcticum]|uniref:Flagellar M-ring protein n=2 Tax=Roseicitreum antarcticum TaxID=564137 RepID=A0A1H2URD1_9RHOB|nr:flagellar M-ring protein FliF [Roseicitreum antarcticum]